MGVLYLAAGRLLRISEIEELIDRSRAVATRSWWCPASATSRPDVPLGGQPGWTGPEPGLRLPRALPQQLAWLRGDGLRGVSIRELCQAREPGKPPGWSA